MGRPKILFLHYVTPYNRVKTRRYEDGCATSLRALEKDFDITWQNLAAGFHVDPKGFDLLLVQSNWGWIPDRFARKNLAEAKIPRALLIGGTATPPETSLMRFYDLLFYETEWYRPQLENHHRVVHAFGIDTDVMKPAASPAKKRYDWITVGGVFDFKRQHLLLEKNGKRLLIGELQRSWYCWKLLAKMALSGVEIRDYTHYETLAELYRASRTTYLPATVYGGGERAVLESRACGTEVEIEGDNPKLRELLTGPIWDHHYYTKQLKSGLDSIL